MEHARTHIHERAAVPKYLEILPELPKTAVGKIFKPDLRKLAIKRVYNEALEGTGASVTEVVEDKKRGLVAKVARNEGVDETVIAQKLGEFTLAWDWA
jgi:fatty-acyl-CoA synthase